MHRSCVPLLLALLCPVGLCPIDVGAAELPPPTGAAQAQADAVQLRMYDVTDLLVRPHDMPARGLGILGVMKPATSAAKQEAEIPVVRTPTTEELLHPPLPTVTCADFLAGLFPPAMAAELAPCCELRGGSTLFVTARPAYHEHIAAVLDAARKRQGMEVSVHTREFLMSPDHRQSDYPLAGLPWREVLQQPGVRMADLSVDEARAVIARLQGDDQVEALGSVQLTTFSGQQGNASMTNARVFQQALPYAGGEQQIGILTLGRELDVRGTATDDGRFLHLELTTRSLELLEMRKDPATGVELPITADASLQLDRMVEDGRVLLIAQGTRLAADRSLRTGFLVVEARTWRAGTEQNPFTDPTRRPALP